MLLQALNFYPDEGALRKLLQTVHLSLAHMIRIPSERTDINPRVVIPVAINERKIIPAVGNVRKHKSIPD